MSERRCPVCGRQGGPDDRFCEVDGTALTNEPDPALQMLSPVAGLGAATHGGKAHRVNEDAIDVVSGERDGCPFHLLVVCDGVSSSSHGEEVSAVVAEQVRAAVLAAAQAPARLDPPAALRQAVSAAHRAACTADIAMVPGKDPPGTTLVVAFAHGDDVDVAWVGDSRAYLVGPEAQGMLLTRDHSWVNEVVDAGEMSLAEAQRSPQAHALTRCLGPLENADPDCPPEPGLGTCHMSAGSVLILCTDGIWNVAPEPERIAELARRPSAGAAGLARDMVQYAVALGSRDDVSAAVLYKESPS